MVFDSILKYIEKWRQRSFNSNEVLEGALGLLGKIKDRDDKNNAMRDLAAALAICDRLDEGLQMISRITDNMQHDFAYREIARYYIKKRNYEKAKDYFQFPKNQDYLTEFWFEMALSQAENKDYENCKEILKQVATQSKYFDYHVAATAWQAHKNSDFEEAESLLLLGNEDNEEISATRVVFLLYKGQKQEAIKQAELLASSKVWKLLQQHLTLLGEIEEAEKMLEKLPGKEMKELAYIYLAEAAITKGNLELKENYILKIQDAAARDLHRWGTAGHLAKCGYLKEAYKEVEMINKNDGIDKLAMMQIVCELIKQKKIVEAIHGMKKLKKSFAHDCYRLLIDYYLLQNDLKSAWKWVKKAKGKIGNRIDYYSPIATRIQFALHLYEKETNKLIQ
ncbi:MAG: hypothetical protein IT236_01350 [Bacteroidia bacterium]|nr:hypothetical protein [Bacteroidia bacterium]